MANPEVSIIVPLYNEERVFNYLISRLDKLVESLDFPVEIVLIDDGSGDNTPLFIREVALKNKTYKAVFLSRNFGHQIAVTAGMASVSCSHAVMIIDGDLQDPPELLPEFYQKIKQGYDVVYAIRKKRKENFFKKTSYWGFYRLLQSISEINIPLDSGDFCMMTRKVNDIVVTFPEQSRFIRGIRTWVGFNQIGLEYERDCRKAGTPKYTLKKLVKLAYDGIFNFSYVPLKFITNLGFYTILISSLYLLFVLMKKLLGYSVPSGFTTLIFAITLFSGVQLVCIGIIGEYVSRIFMQVKNRPLYIIKSVIENGHFINES
jgi:dolichol-phosphate mannosyltransferase